MIKLVARPTERAHQLIRQHVEAGDHVVDATLGNGHDTLFLAELVGKKGRVDGFDIQGAAIQSAQQKLHDRDFDRVHLHHVGHEKISDQVQTPIQAVMFNLGYLPGGDKQVITQAQTTLQALRSALDLLLPNGIVTIVAYIGHAGGSEEADAILTFCQTLKSDQFTVTQHRSASDNAKAPFLITIVRG
ncbi:MAG: class I SAM-dependent methyltransferase [Verrucomicrobiota bacterium]